MPPGEKRRGRSAAPVPPQAPQAPRSVTDYASFRTALLAFWRDAHDKHCGMVSRAILPQLAEPPPPEVWAALVAHDDHPVAQALAKAGSAPLLVSLNGWLATLPGQPPESRLDGASVGAALAARFVRSHLPDGATLRQEMRRLVTQQGDRRRERKVWAAAENLPLAEEEAPSAAQRGIMELYAPDGDTGAPLAAALYVGASEGKLLEVLDAVVNCVKDLADLAARYEPETKQQTEEVVMTDVPLDDDWVETEKNEEPPPPPPPSPPPQSQQPEEDASYHQQPASPLPPPPAPWVAQPAALLPSPAVLPVETGFRRDLRLALEKTRTMYAPPLVP